MRYEYAGFWRRLFATFVDLPWLLFPLLVFFHLYEGQEVLLKDWTTLTIEISQTPWFVAVLGIPFLLVIWCWLKWAATPGKLLFDCDVIDIRTGRPVTLIRALLRCLAYILSFMPLGLGFLWILWDQRKQAWHDKIAGTIVVIHDESTVPIEQLLEGN